MTHIRLSGHGSPVVLEPGLGASSVGWSRLHELLAERTRILSYDRAGLGATPPTSGHRDLTALAAGLAEVISTVGAGPSVIVGHSLGGTIARQLAATRPELVAGLVLVDPIPDDWVLRHAYWAGPPGALMYLAMQATAHIGLIDTLTALPFGRAIVRSSTSPLGRVDRRGTRPTGGRTTPTSPTPHRAGRVAPACCAAEPQLRAWPRTPPAIPLTVISGTKTHDSACRCAARQPRGTRDWP